MNRGMRVLLIAVLLATAAGISVSVRRSQQQPEQVLPAPLPEIGSSAYLNTAGGEYVGVQVCAECHPEQHRSYLGTAHSRSFRKVEPRSEPAGGEFRDPGTGRIYQIDTQGGEYRHRESAVLPDGDEFEFASLPMRFAIGSGRFSISYLAERHGFLVESPATWYAATSEWGLSPGYEKHNSGFERPVTGECVNCHVGRAAHAGGSIQRFEFAALTIDCERCHGPGSLHVARWSAEKGAHSGLDASAGDPTIVHPGRLPPAEAEAVCAQCHMHSEAVVELRGRRMADYRPGLRLRDFCVHYGLETPSQEMRVVGHVEQLRLSLCYSVSGSLTCTSCHDPHADPDADRSADFFRAKCVTCHGESSCGLERDVRMRSSPADDCVQCHMPKSSTDIPHFAFTHHRIGLHDDNEVEDPAPRELGTIVPLDDVSDLPKLDRDRGLGLAYLQLAASAGSQAEAGEYLARSEEILRSVYRRGLHDDETTSALARLSWRQAPLLTLEFAEATLEQETTRPESRITALFTLATTLIDQGRHEEALPHLEKLVQLRLYSEDWYWLSVCRARQGDVGGGAAAAERAAELSPQYPQLHEHLADLYRQNGRDDEARASAARAMRLKTGQIPAR